MNSWNRRTEARILVAEDSSTQAAQLAAILEDYGYEAVIAVDGEQALALVHDQPPALIISDVVMPKMDGYTLCHAIKQNEASKHIPVILVTTLSDPYDVLRGLECGADNFIRKPIDGSYLLSRIDYLLMNRQLRLHQRTQMGLEIDLRGQRYFINSDRQQILDLLISTYEQAVDLNKELALNERELAKSNEVLDSLYKIADELNKAVTPQEVLQSAIDHVMNLPDVHAAWISLDQRSDNTFKVVASQNAPFPVGSEHPNPHCQCLSHLQSGADKATVNILSCECLHDLDDAMHGLHSHATVPLSLSNGSKAGVMNIVAPDEYGFDDAQLQMFAGVGNQLTVALERAELHENLEKLVEERTAQVKRLNRLYSVLSGINSSIVRTRTQAELFSEVCRIAVDDGKFALAWIGTLDEHGQKVDKIAFSYASDDCPSPECLAQAATQIEQTGLLKEALEREGPALRNSATTNKPSVFESTQRPDYDYRSMAVLPLSSNSGHVAVCVLYSLEPGVFDDPEEIALLVELAGDIGYALGYQENERQLNYLAYYDNITGLPNRTLLADRLNQALQDAARHNDFIGVAILDLDRFKNINDSLGHSTGDALLKAVAERLAGVIREGDTVARVAADEFGFIFTDMRREEDASHIVAKLFESFGQPFIIGEHELFVSASLGIAVYPNDGDEVETLMQSADAALYRAKAEGRNRYQFYSSDMTSKARERLSMENDLRRALDKEEFLVHYQPVINANTGDVCGVEALIRWQSPERGLVPPFFFIPIAEETNLIIDIGAWVMEESCRQVTKGWGDLASNLTVAVNVSTRQFLQSDFLEMVTGVIERTGIDPTRLTLEITESHLMENVDEMVAVMHKLGELGITFSIDDFGTGYSSLAYLKNLPIANLKIDRSFVMNLPDNADDASIVKTIISMAHSLNHRVIAEGVETKEQLEFLQAHNCDAIQGYYFSKPVPANELAALLRKNKLNEGGSDNVQQRLPESAPRAE